MKRLSIFLIILTTLLCGCKKNESEEPAIADRTVLIYMASENDLARILADDLNQIRRGTLSMTGNNRLVIYVDEANRGANPYMVRLANGETVDSLVMETDTPTSDPATLLQAMRLTMSHYPANEYGLVLWGHADGWLIENDSIVSDVWMTPHAAPRKAYGRDTEDNSTNTSKGSWMNIPSMARALSMVPKLKFIFADCCSFQTVESAYELRKVTDYIIGSPAEIPYEGAPYHTVVPALFEKESFWTSIVDKYSQQIVNSKRPPLSVIKTSEIEQLAAATRTALAEVVPSLETPLNPDMSGLIHYYYHGATYKFYDMNDFMLRYASTETYTTWKDAFDRAVVYRIMSSRWATNVTWNQYYADFTITEEKYGGISMYVPQIYYQWSLKDKISKLGWYYAAGLSDVGW